MAKKVKSAAVVANVNIDLLKQIAAATTANSVFYVGKVPDVEALIAKSFIVINTEMPDPSDASKVASRTTDQGMEFLKSMSNVQASVPVASAPSTFAIITNAVLPPSKRGNKGGGAPKKYPFDDLQIGGSFFVGKSADLPDPVKTLGSTVSAANMRFAKETGETKQVERVKRGKDHKGEVDAAGNKVKETVTVPVYKFERKFSLRSVKVGEKYGEWVAPADGALIGRIAIE